MAGPVGVFHVERDALSGPWLPYAFFWWPMFVCGEIGQAIGPKHSVQEAAAGVASKTIYLPLSACLTQWLLGASQQDASETSAPKAG